MKEMGVENNGMYMAVAYTKNNVPVEYHLFEHGGHGLSLATEETLIPFKYVTPWFKLSVRWLKERGFTIKNKE